MNSFKFKVLIKDSGDFEDVLEIHWNLPGNEPYYIRTSHTYYRSFATFNDCILLQFIEKNENCEIYKNLETGELHKIET